MNRMLSIVALCAVGVQVLGGAPQSRAETNYYHFWRTFQLRPAPSDANTYNLHMEAARLSGVVGPFNIKTTAPPFATEYEGVSWSRTSATSAWHYVTAAGSASYYGYDSNVFTNVVFDNVGWVTGTTNVLGQWGAYAWLLQNTLRFQSSTSDYYVSSLGKTSEVGSVLVGTIGDYCPLTTTTNTGPRWSTNYPGENGAMITNMQADTRAFYKLVRKMDLSANDGDADHDGIPNYADGFDWGTDPDDNQPGSFVFTGWPLLFSGYAHTQATLRLTYSASDPAAMTLSNGVYTPAAGHLRLWKRNGYQRRNKAGAHTNAAGDFIPAGEMNPQAVFGATGRMAMVYIETIAPASNQVLVFEIDPDGSNGPAGFACVDRIGTTVLSVDMDHDLWWFNGEDPGGGYNITATLTVSPLTTGTFKWDVIAGSDKVDLNNGGADADSITATDDNTVTVKSTSPSAAAASVTKDVTVQLTYNGTPVCTFDLAVFAPHSLHHLANIDHDYAALPPPYPDYTGYWCEIKYEILDQFDRVLPYDVPWNEDFNKDGANPVSGISDYSGENWGWGPESGWSVPPSGAIDNLARPDLPGLVPPAQNVGSGTVKVDHVIGAWYVGSTTIGDGVLVLDNNKWQMYQDHGRHE